jgi:hypothetical protein
MPSTPTAASARIAHADTEQSNQYTNAGTRHRTPQTTSQREQAAATLHSDCTAPTPPHSTEQTSTTNSKGARFSMVTRSVCRNRDGGLFTRLWRADDLEPTTLQRPKKGALAAAGVLPRLGKLIHRCGILAHIDSRMSRSVPLGGQDWVGPHLVVGRLVLGHTEPESVGVRVDRSL